MDDELKRLLAWAATPEGAAAVQSVQHARKRRRVTKKQARAVMEVTAALGEIARSVVPAVVFEQNDGGAR